MCNTDWGVWRLSYFDKSPINNVNEMDYRPWELIRALSTIQPFKRVLSFGITLGIRRVKNKTQKDRNTSRAYCIHELMRWKKFVSFYILIWYSYILFTSKSNPDEKLIYKVLISGLKVHIEVFWYWPVCRVKKRRKPIREKVLGDLSHRLQNLQKPKLTSPLSANHYVPTSGRDIGIRIGPHFHVFKFSHRNCWLFHW